MPQPIKVHNFTLRKTLKRQVFLSQIKVICLVLTCTIIHHTRYQYVQRYLLILVAVHLVYMFVQSIYCILVHDYIKRKIIPSCFSIRKSLPLDQILWYHIITTNFTDPICKYPFYLIITQPQAS